MTMPPEVFKSDQDAQPSPALQRDGHPDRPAPVLAHDDEVLEAEVVDGLADDLGMLRRRVAVTGRALGEPEAGILDRNATKAATGA